MMASQLNRPAATATNPQAGPAIDLIAQAFHDFEQIITPHDARTFANTTLDDVRKAARDIEKQLEARQSMCNMRRLEPLFNGLAQYKGPIEVLCNGTPYLPWIWAPIKLVLQIASDFHDVFKQLIDAYSQIAETLPRFDRLSDAFRTNLEFQQVLAVFYVDIVRFHREAYKLVKRSAWGRLQRRFKGILTDLRKHAEIVEREAYTIDISEAQKWRHEARDWRDHDLARIASEEKQHSVVQYQAVTSWLEYRESEQSDILDGILLQYCEGTSDWTLQNTEMASWLRNQDDKRFLLLIGKPGSGKSVIMSHLVQFELAAKHSSVIYHFCTNQSSPSVQHGNILRSITSQLIRDNDDLIAYVYDEYLLRRRAASTTVLEQLVPLLLSALSNDPSKTVFVKIFLDGIDECEDEKQQKFLNWLQNLSTISGSKSVCKVLVSGRDTPRIVNFTKRKSNLSLSREHQAVAASIRSYVHERFQGLRLSLQDKYIAKNDMDQVEEAIAERSNGMFLWARLVSDIISSDMIYDVEEMRTAVETMPKELNTFYCRILDRISSRKGEVAVKKIRLIMSWIAFSQRKLKQYELQSALAFQWNLQRVPPSEALDLCKPLVELNSDNTLVFVHNTVQEFLTQPESGPFLQRELAYMHQTMSCTQALLSRLDVFHDGYDDYQRSLRVVRGMHGMHVFANEFWIENLLRFVQTQNLCKSSEATSLLNLVDYLCMRITSIEPRILPEGTCGEALDPRLSLLKQRPAIYQAVQYELLKRSQTLSAESDSDSGVTTSDLSSLDATLCAYQAKLQALIHLDSLVGVTSDELAHFKRVFRSSAFTCRRAGCIRSTSGFETDELRCDHERVHSQLLRCTVAACHYSMPFSSAVNLRKHMAKYHPVEDLPTRPKGVRRPKPDQNAIPGVQTPEQPGQNLMQRNFSKPVQHRIMQITQMLIQRAPAEEKNKIILEFSQLPHHRQQQVREKFGDPLTANFRAAAIRIYMNNARSHNGIANQGLQSSQPGGEIGHPGQQQLVGTGQLQPTLTPMPQIQPPISQFNAQISHAMQKINQKMANGQTVVSRRQLPDDLPKGISPQLRMTLQALEDDFYEVVMERIRKQQQINMAKARNMANGQQRRSTSRPDLENEIRQ